MLRAFGPACDDGRRHRMAGCTRAGAGDRQDGPPECVVGDRPLQARHLRWRIRRNRECSIGVPLANGGVREQGLHYDGRPGAGRLADLLGGWRLGVELDGAAARRRQLRHFSHAVGSSANAKHGAQTLHGLGKAPQSQAAGGTVAAIQRGHSRGVLLKQQHVARATAADGGSTLSGAYQDRPPARAASGRGTGTCAAFLAPF
mmetsp:Transcript_34361/g.99785  ORF Transcript_34361/g.99785 Transcript_34361/m.99785 type:complete len:202 (-) Transcript_34361:110-715(-)